MKLELEHWVKLIEEQMPSIREEPGHFINNPLSALKLADWCERFMTIVEKNKKEKRTTTHGHPGHHHSPLEHYPLPHHHYC